MRGDARLNLGLVLRRFGQGAGVGDAHQIGINHLLAKPCRCVARVIGDAFAFKGFQLGQHIALPLQAQAAANMGAHGRVNAAFADKPIKAAIFMQQAKRQGKRRMRHILGADIEQPRNVFRLCHQQHIMSGFL